MNERKKGQIDRQIDINLQRLIEIDRCEERKKERKKE